MFDEDSESVKSFTAICAEYQIPRTDFLKYLQVCHIIVSLHKKGQFRLYPTELEQFIISATSLKGKISHLYRILSESPQNSCSSLRTNWELELKKKFSKKEWLSVHGINLTFDYKH